MITSLGCMRGFFCCAGIVPASRPSAGFGVDRVQVAVDRGDEDLALPAGYNLIRIPPDCESRGPIKRLCPICGYTYRLLTRLTSLMAQASEVLEISISRDSPEASHLR